MNEYFISGEVTKLNKTFSCVRKDNSAFDAHDNTVNDISNKLGVEKEDVHIKTMTKVS